MKKMSVLPFLIMVLFVWMSPSVAFGQDSSDGGSNSESRFGIRGGVLIAKQTYDEGNLTEDPESKFGLDLALVSKLPLGGGFFMLQPELHWMQKGSTISDVNGDEFTTTMNYLELPVFVRLNFGGSAKIFAMAGPSAGYLIGVDSDIDDAKDLYEDFDFSMNLGAGIGLGAFEIDVRYAWGLTDIADATHPTEAEIKNSHFGAGLTFFF